MINRLHDEVLQEIAGGAKAVVAKKKKKGKRGKKSHPVRDRAAVL